MKDGQCDRTPLAGAKRSIGCGVCTPSEPITPTSRIAERHFKGLCQLANTYFAEIPDPIRDRIAPRKKNRSLDHIRFCSVADRQRIERLTERGNDEWIHTLFHLAWEHPSSALRAEKYVYSVPLPGVTTDFSPGVYGPYTSCTGELSPLPRGHRKAFPHTFLSWLKHDVWRSSVEAIEVIFKLAAIVNPGDTNPATIQAPAKVSQLTPLESAALELRDEQLSDGKLRSFGQVADQLNARGFKKKNGSPQDYHSAKAAYRRAAAKQ